MVKIQNSDAIKAIRDNARLSISEGFPQDLSLTAVPTMDMTPDFHRISNVLAFNSNTVSGTINATLPSGKRVFVTQIHCSMVKNATCDTATAALLLAGVIGGKTIRFALPNVLTLTAERFDLVLPYNPPIEVDAGSDIGLTGTFTAGAMCKSVTIIGYEVEK